MVRSPWSHCVVYRAAFVCRRGDPIDFILLFFVLGIAVVLLIAAFRLRSTVNSEKESQGIPKGLVLYSDLNVPATPLFSRRLLLTGKPDYIVRRGSQYIPVEVKTGRRPQPSHSHVLQLAAYCQILEDTSGEFVPEGILVYNTVQHSIPFDPQLRFELEQVMRTMRSSIRDGFVERNHEEPGRCQACSMRRYCSECLRKD